MTGVGAERQSVVGGAVVDDRSSRTSGYEGFSLRGRAPMLFCLRHERDASAISNSVEQKTLLSSDRWIGTREHELYCLCLPAARPSPSWRLLEAFVHMINGRLPNLAFTFMIPRKEGPARAHQAKWNLRPVHTLPPGHTDSGAALGLVRQHSWEVRRVGASENSTS